MRKSLALFAAVSSFIALTLTSPASAATQEVGPWTQGPIACGALYPEGKTVGAQNIWVSVAGSYESAYFAGGGEVRAVGVNHSGTVTSWADSTISSWGFVGCSLV